MNNFLFIVLSLSSRDVIRSGFEPETHSLEGCCSIQLSYRTPRLNGAQKACKGTAFFLYMQIKS